MGKNKLEKTNVMRVLDQKKIPYQIYTYEEGSGPLGDHEYGLHVAQSIGKTPEMVFKTLVGRGASKGTYVFCIPVAESLDLKKTAKAVGEKSMELIAVKEILDLTGYIRGGCSPVGMKKQYPTIFHESVLNCEQICVSAGKIGMQVELTPDALLALVRGETADIIVQEL